MERQIEELKIPQPREEDLQNGFKKLDEDFKPNVVHLEIIKQAKRGGGEYDRILAVKKILESDNDQKLKNQMVIWNKKNIETLIEKGYLKKGDKPEKYIANPIVYEIRKKEFEPGLNHAKLLKQHEDGILKTSVLNEAVKKLDEKSRKRQENFNKKMLKNLNENGYIERLDRGEYKITDRGYKFLSDIKKTPTEKKAAKGFKVTAFDKLLSEVIEDGKISKELLGSHRRRESIEKRIETYEKEGYIKNGTLTEECKLMLEKAKQYSKNEELTLERLTGKQLALIKDMRIFLTLSKKQILEHIYEGNEVMLESDLKFLIKRNVLQKDDNIEVYILGKKGVWLTNEMFRGEDAVKYSPKLYKKPTELEHDMLVYTAYKHWAKEIAEQGGRILEVKNDRQMRKDMAKEFGHMVGEISDLKVIYEMPGEKQLCTHDIEMDIQYSRSSIIKKMNGIMNVASGGMTKMSKTFGSRGKRSGTTAVYVPVKNTGLSWYCKDIAQATKVVKTISKSFSESEKANKKNVARKLEVYYMDADGTLQRVNHSFH